MDGAKDMNKKTYFISHATKTESDIKWAIWTEWFFREMLGGKTIMMEYDFRVGKIF